MEPKDPFGWITEACQMSSSEESRLRCCTYFGLSDSDDSVSDCRNPPDIGVASTGITMVSPPESPEDELPNDQYIPEDQEIFHTPPESRSTSTSFDNCNDDRMMGNDLDRDRETVPIDADCADSGRTVDLWRDTDLGFSEVEVDLTQRIEANSNEDDTCRRESEEIKVSKREFSAKGKLSTESPSKRLKTLDFESPSVRLGTPKEGSTEELLKSLKNVSPSLGATSELELENQQNPEFNFEVGEGSVRKRRLDFSTEAIDSESKERNMETENNNGEDSSSGGKSLDVFTKDMKCHTEEINIENETDNGERNSGRNKNIVGDIDQARCIGENGSNSRAMEEKTERKRALPSWANWMVEGDESADEELEVSETELPSGANGRVEDDEAADEELEVNERKLPSRANGRVGDDERADEELDVNERKTVHSSMDSDSLNENFDEVTILDVLMKLEKDCEEDRSLECLSLLEVAEKKWGKFSSAV